MNDIDSFIEHKKPLIMLVDDIIRNLQVIGDHLVNEGYDVSFATSGLKALEIIEEVMPDLILLDVMMPEMNGFEVCEKLMQNKKTKNIPVIFLTAKTETKDLLTGFKVGGVDYITKPFQKDEILARIRTHLELKFARELLAKNAERLKSINEKIQIELQSAAEFVKSLIPNPYQNEILDISWKFVPSDQLGGDSFGYHKLDDENFAFYLLDVSGHGVSSALYSVSILNNLRLQTLPKTDFTNPEEVFNALNEAYQMNDNNGLYFTIWYGVFNKQSRILKHAAAGHPPPALINSEGNIQNLLSPNFIIGGLEKYNFQSDETFINEGSRLYVFSDGCFDFKKHDGTYWTISELYQFLALNNQLKSPLSQLLDKVKELQNSDLLKDDLSVMQISFK